MITREQVADLEPGDVVEFRDERFPDVVVRGPVRRLDSDKGMAIGGNILLAYSNGRLPDGESKYGLLTVISRAPRPLYVNHPRTSPSIGDVVNPTDGTLSIAFRTTSGWIWPNGARARLDEPGLRLLVDGETGQVVP